MRGHNFKVLITTLLCGCLAGTAALAAGGSAAAAAAPAPLRIDTGGTKTYTDRNGNPWSADRNFSGGTVLTSTASIAGVSDPAVLRTGRVGMSAYRLPVAKGSYSVQLLFAETQHRAVRKRVFTVKAEGTTVAAGLDVFAKVGANTRYSVTSPTLKVTDGILDLTFTSSTGAALISGIVVTPVTVTPTPTPTPTRTPTPTAPAGYRTDLVETARPVSDLLDTVGVNVHMRYYSTPYGRPDAIVQRLRQLGIRSVRNNLAPGDPREIAALQQLQAAGITFNFLQAGAGTSIDAMLAEIRTYFAGSTVSIEGLNEADSTGDGWPARLCAAQTSLYTLGEIRPAARVDPRPRAVPDR